MRLLLVIAACVFMLNVKAQTVLEFSPSASDMTEQVREALENCADKQVKLKFEKGTYYFRPDYAQAKYCVITNHGNGIKNIIFNFDGFESVEIEGNGSDFIFHGQEFPFLFENCKQITVSGLTIDWDIPFTFLCEVVAVNEQEEWRDIKPFTEGFSWKLEQGRIEFPNVDGFSYSYLGSTLAFEAKEKRVVHGAWDLMSNPKWVEELPNGNLRIHEKLRQYPPVGSLLSSKGDREHDRYAPAFEIKASKNILLKNVVVHHALGMGYLFERSENITISGCGVHLQDGSPRVISSTADATHFANCKGDILIENCRFENMLDDGTNVHGTYVVVNKILDSNRVRVELVHFEQLGFEFAAAGDEVWFIKQPDPNRAEVNMVEQANAVNERFIELTFKEPIPADLKIGDIVENKTWNPTFTMRGCTIRDHRARNIVLKTPLKTVIEDNQFSSMMSSVLFRGESFFWYESGAVEDVIIRNNTFDYCAYSGTEQAVLNITPRLGKTFDQTVPYDRNIRFENNTIRNFAGRVVWADRADGLVVSGNTITQTFDAEPLFPDAAVFEFVNCRDTKVLGNNYNGTSTNVVAADEASKKTLELKKNKGF